MAKKKLVELEFRMLENVEIREMNFVVHSVVQRAVELVSSLFLWQ